MSTEPAPLLASLVGVLGAQSGASSEPRHPLAVQRALDRVDEQLSPASPLRLTGHEEYQAGFVSVGAALRASLRLSLLLPSFEVRHGIGWGEFDLREDDGLIGDGAGWWAARAAVDSLGPGGGRAALTTVRTAYVRADTDAARSGPHPAAVNAALLTRDQIVGTLPPRARSLLVGLLEGRTQRELAEDEGISASAVSQQVRGHGLAVVVAADAALFDLT